MRIDNLSTHISLVCIACALTVLGGCGVSTDPVASARAGSDPLRVTVSIPPLSGLAARIGGERIEVEALVAPGQEPHTFAITPRQAMALGDTAAYFHVGGFAFERELSKRVEANFPALEVCDVSEDITRIAGGCTHHHHGHGNQGHAHAHHHGHCDHETDPHVWMAPPTLALMAESIAATLVRVDPAHAAAYEANLRETLAELEALDGELRALLAPYEGKTFYIYHPALGYFAQAYGLHQKAVEFEGKKPTPRQLQELVAQARSDGARVIFVQPQFDVRSAESIAEAIGGSVVTLDPLRADVFANLREIAAELAEAFSRENAPS